MFKQKLFSSQLALGYKPVLMGYFFHNCSIFHLISTYIQANYINNSHGSRAYVTEMDPNFYLLSKICQYGSISQNNLCSNNSNQKYLCKDFGSVKCGIRIVDA